VAPGTYNEVINTTKDGTASAPIRFVSDVKGGAVIKPSGTSGAIWTNAGDYVTIEGFEIDGSASPAARVGITAHGNQVYVKYNEVHHIAQSGFDDSKGGAGINLTGSYYNEVGQHVIGNVVHHIATPDSTRVHGIYHHSTGTIANNVVYAVEGVGIVLWHDAKDLLIANNTSFNNRVGISVGSGDWYQGRAPADNVRVINNLVYDNQGVGIDEHGLTGTNNVYQNNLVYGNGTAWGLQNGNSHSGTISADPMFVNYRADGGGDYGLRAGSPAIDKGTSAYSAPTADADGYLRAGAPDIGAYEWKSVSIDLEAAEGSTEQ
jgi:hypothetical protein